MKIDIRPACESDAEFVGWAAVIAARSHLARGWFEIVLHRDEAFCVAFAANVARAKAVSWWHWSLFRVAEVEGVPVSALCGFGDPSVYEASGEAMAEAADRMGIPKSEQAQFWPRGAFIISATTSEPGAWTIENVATKPDFRGKGITLELLKAELAAARAKGFRRAQISFLLGNDRAEKTYLKAGFVFAEEKHAADLEAAMGTPGIRRLARDL